MTSSKIRKSIAFLSIALLTATTIRAQIATPEGEIQGGNKKDTSHFVDKPSMHVHEETIVTEIKKAKSKAGKGNEESGGKNSVDSTQQASNTASPNSPSDSIAGFNQGEAGGNSDMTAQNTSATASTVSQNTAPLYAALTAFGIGALIGLFLLAMVLRGNKTSRLMALVHGALGLVGIGMLIVYSMFYSGLVVSLVILAIAATGGIIIFYKDISNEPIPKWLGITHGVVAIAGIITLIVYAIGK